MHFSKTHHPALPGLGTTRAQSGRGHPMDPAVSRPKSEGTFRGLSLLLAWKFYPPDSTSSQALVRAPCAIGSRPWPQGSSHWPFAWIPGKRRAFPPRRQAQVCRGCCPHTQAGPGPRQHRLILKSAGPSTVKGLWSIHSAPSDPMGLCKHGGEGGVKIFAKHE